MGRIAFAVFIATLLAVGTAAAECPGGPPDTQAAKPGRHHDKCVNLGGVPQISANIVAAEPAPAVKSPTPADPTSTAYQGPTLGMTKPDPGVKPVPTVGFKWSLE